MVKNHIHQEKKLNKEQEQAVHFGKGPLLIIAGAGTGKTTVIIERIKHLITRGLALPAEILALTFTEKAAREMEERVDQALPYGYTQMWISTFHSFCDRILKAEALNIGLNPGYRLLSDADATQMMRKQLFKMNSEYFRPLGNPTKFIMGMLQHFSRLMDEDISPIQYLSWVKSQNSELNDQKTEEELLENKKYLELATAYHYYDDFKIKEGLMDFGDLIAKTLYLFRARPNVLKNYQNKFKFILVDEFQDTNIAQNELVMLLAGKTKNITAVCDDDQSIYKFRGAAVSNVLSFRKNYPKSKLIVLTQNYRSTQSILDHSYKLIQHNNPDRLEVKEKINKKLVSVRNIVGKLPIFLHADRVENEADEVAKEIKKLIDDNFQLTDKKEKYSWKDVAILVRANSHAEPFIRALSRHGVPYQFLGPGKLFRQPEIKELIAYLELLSDISDDLACFRVLSMAYFDIPIRDLATMTSLSNKYGLTLFETCELVAGERAIEKVDPPKIQKSTSEKITTFTHMVERHLTIKLKETAGQILYYFLSDTGLLKNVLENKFPIDEQKAANIMKFFGKLKTYEAEHEDASVATVLDWILLLMELGESPLAADTDWVTNDAVNILTVHGSKGLEFPIVFLVNLVSQRFPSNERHEQIPIPEEIIKEELPEGDYHEEEERRLFYVGMTRARDLLYLTAANYYGEGKREKKVSKFVGEALGIEAITNTQETKIDQLSLLDWQKMEAPATLSIKSQPITYLSYSQIETFELCPLHYKLKYLLGVPTPKTPALSFGISMHAVLKSVYERVQKKEEINEKITLSLLDSHWINEGYKSREYEKKMKDRGVKYLHDFFVNTFDQNVKPVLLEEKFTVPLGETFLKIGGKIDRVDVLDDGKIEIIDYKTGRVPTKREVDKNLQLSMYAIAASFLQNPPFGKKPEDILLTLYYFDNQEKITTTRTREQLETEKKRIIEIAKKIELSDFRCSKNKICAYCEYTLFCEMEA